MPHRIAITPGEPAGIGPDLLVTLAQHGHNHELVAIADPVLLQQRASLLGLPLTLREFNPTAPPRSLSQSELLIAPVKLKQACQPGQLNAANAAYVLETLDRAIAMCQQGQTQALVTGPVHKGIINDAAVDDKNLLGGRLFQGHTEYLAEACQRDTVVMMLATRGLRVALVTTHVPLNKVAESITAEKLQRTLEILRQSMQSDFALVEPRILVCGLNPHAGEGGHLGREEVDIIIPVLDKLRQQGFHLIGPLPADTLFTPKVIAQGDVVLAMYHDQGLPVLKYKGFGNAVNITLGLPIVRTSVDHGTALDLAATGKANIGSLQTAIDYAIAMAGGRSQTNTKALAGNL
jgi:4-hydroxythreonine-4-phosphate dehydrogenase